jgi:hypothetical protein
VTGSAGVTPGRIVNGVETEADRDTAGLLALARQLRDAAAGAGRTDVVAKTDALIVQIAEGDRGADRGSTVVRFLDGLGL